MKTRLTIALFAAALIVPAAARAADEAKPAPKPEEKPRLAIVVIENLSRFGGAITDFDRLDIAFHKVAKERKWPVELVAERFAANLPDYKTELRIFDQPLRYELPGELTFRGWMILRVDGKKHDFGVVVHHYWPRPAENNEDILDAIYLGLARQTADLIEPILFPKKEAAQPGS